LSVPCNLKTKDKGSKDDILFKERYYVYKLDCNFLFFEPTHTTGKRHAYSVCFQSSIHSSSQFHDAILGNKEALSKETSGIQ
jgi:hypothetical protein